MGFKRVSPLVLRLAAGALGLAGLLWLLLELVIHTRLYATALIVAVTAAFVVWGLARAIARTDLVLAEALETLAAGSADRASRPVRGFPALGEAVEAASRRLRRDQAATRSEGEGLRALLDTVPAALLVLFDDGSVELANRAAFAFTGADVRRLDDMAVLGAEAVSAIRALPPGGRAVAVTADGRRMLASASRIRRPGEPAAALIALQGVAEDLGVVEQRAWSDLIRVLAHEMMNSLTPIASLSESLAGRPGGDPDGQAALKVIARRAENLMAFVDRYRALADLPDPAPRPIAVKAFVEDIARLMSGQGAVLGAAVEPADLLVPGDPALLEQALINLVKNAVEATRGRADPAVVLSARAAEGRVLISVADNGEGVAPDKAEAIFVPFYTSRPGGSGVGLSLARQIILAHGGQLTVRPNAPKGAVFEISLPGGA